MLFGSLVLLVSSVILIANTIRLSIFSRRHEIEVMKLVGATNWFVRAPFMLEGLLCGLVGSLLAVTLLFAADRIALSRVLGGNDGVEPWALPAGRAASWSASACSSEPQAPVSPCGVFCESEVSARGMPGTRR